MCSGSSRSLPNAVHDFRVGTLDVDVETGTVDTAPTENGTNVDLESGANYGYDATGLDDGYDPWAYQYNGSAFDTYNFDENWGWGDFWEPIVLDLDGNGIQLIAREDSGAEFDLDGDGYDERTAWVGAGDGLLVLNDASNDLTPAEQAAAQVASGLVISERHEVAFAAAGSGQTDLEALRANYDSNNDGFLTSADTRWADFRIWIDTNADGYSDPDYTDTPGINENEVFTLAQLGITSFSLTSDNRTITLPDNSIINGFSTFTQNGVAHALADVAFSYDPIGQYAPRERLFGPAANQVGGIFYEGEDGTSLYVVDAGRSTTGGVSDLNRNNTVAVGATLTFAGGVILNWGGFVGGNHRRRDVATRMGCRPYPLGGTPSEPPVFCEGM